MDHREADIRQLLAEVESRLAEGEAGSAWRSVAPLALPSPLSPLSF